MSNIPTARNLIHGARVRAILASRWAFGSPDDRDTAAATALASVQEVPGLLGFNIYRELDGLSLFVLSSWGDPMLRDAALTAEEARLTALRTASPGVEVAWQETASPYRTFLGESCSDIGCLVVVRQPLKRPDHQIQRAWVDTVMSALASEAVPMPGLCTANFFLSDDGSHVLNLAAWTTADAHRAALQRGRVGQYGGLGDSAAWRATRTHPGILAEHEVRRYEPLAVLELGG